MKRRQFVWVLTEDDDSTPPPGEDAVVGCRVICVGPSIEAVFAYWASVEGGSNDDELSAMTWKRETADMWVGDRAGHTFVLDRMELLS
jgi:hypothetical protein